MIDLSQERATVQAMILLYCRSQLWSYAEERLDKCPFGDEKPTCENCPVHCYKPEMRQRIKDVMRYAGPRMIFHHPIMAIRHLLHNSKKT